MNNTDQSMARCPISYCLDLLGDKWSLRIVRDMLFRGVTRYGELQDSVSGISTNILASRLRQLEADSIIKKYADPEDRKSSVYLLTNKGVELLPVLVAMIRWGVDYDDRSRVPDAIMTILEDRNMQDYLAQRKMQLAQLRSTLMG